MFYPSHWLTLFLFFLYQNRAYSSVASGAVKTNPAYIAGAAAVAGVAGFCMYSSLANSKVALESTLKGDNAWVDLKVCA